MIGGTNPVSRLDNPEPLAGVRFAVVDVETSGLSLRRHHVLQVGVVVVTGNGEVVDRYASLLAPRRRWWFRVGPKHIHGITRRQIRHAPPAHEVLGRLNELLDGATIVAHNARFDLDFLHKAAARSGVELPLTAGAVCTLRMSRALDPERTHSHRLGDLCDRYGITLVRPHDALADADATAALLPYLLAEAGICTADQLGSHIVGPASGPGGSPRQGKSR